MAGKYSMQVPRSRRELNVVCGSANPIGAVRQQAVTDAGYFITDRAAPRIDSNQVLHVDRVEKISQSHDFGSIRRGPGFLFEISDATCKFTHRVESRFSPDFVDRFGEFIDSNPVP